MIRRIFIRYGLVRLIGVVVGSEWTSVDVAPPALIAVIAIIILVVDVVGLPVEPVVTSHRVVG
jgi:hypothetical protein